MSRLHRGIALSTTLVLLLGLTTLWLNRPPTALSDEDALEAFRSAAIATPTHGADDPPADTDPDALGAADDVPGADSEQADAEPDGDAGLAPDSGPGDGQGQTAQGASAPPSPPPPTADPTPALQRPAEGVYRYDTTGYERVDALGGSRHDYPETTHITLRHSACGTVSRWQPLKERWDESELCTAGQTAELRRVSMYHEFFRRGMEAHYACAPGAARVFDRTAATGATWTARCANDDTAMEMTVIVIGPETVQVGPTAVETVRMRYEGKMSGANTGTQVQERWIEPRTGLLVQLDSHGQVQAASPFGPSNYEERYRITLASLQPRR